ncbi:MAG: metallopeptidase family protein [Luteolibacter sp.]
MNFSRAGSFGDLFSKAGLSPAGPPATVGVMDFETLSQWAEEELKAVVEILPPEVREAAQTVSVSFEEKPGIGSFDESLQGDELGLFEGPAIYEESAGDELPRIRLFLRNLWEWTEEEEHDFRDEVGTTFLHELGHYLGWDEDEVAERGLE